jgi:CheY-like chemotaxis protein
MVVPVVVVLVDRGHHLLLLEELETLRALLQVKETMEVLDIQMPQRGQSVEVAAALEQRQQTWHRLILLLGTAATAQLHQFLVRP